MKAESLLLQNAEREQALVGARLDIEIDGNRCRLFVCQGDPVCRRLMPSAEEQESCPFCRVEYYDPGRGWAITDPMQRMIQ